jgi:hypothetical protein
MGRGTPMPAEENKALVRRYFEAIQVRRLRGAVHLPARGHVRGGGSRSGGVRAEPRVSSLRSGWVTDAECDTNKLQPSPATPEAAVVPPAAEPAPVPAVGIAASCDRSYPGVCVPPPDLDCSEAPYGGFAVHLPDPLRFERDSDGIRCERSVGSRRDSFARGAAQTKRPPGRRVGTCVRNRSRRRARLAGLLPYAVGRAMPRGRAVSRSARRCCRRS